MGCYAGSNYGTLNLVDETYEKGSHFVLGTIDVTYTDEVTKWLNGFLDAANQGRTIQECIAAGDKTEKNV